MYPYLLLVAATAVAAIFATPVRRKVWTALAVVGAAAVAAVAVAVRALTVGEVVLARFSTQFFGDEIIVVDRLSAIFLLIMAVASVATLIYSKGYVEHYLKRMSTAHLSLHYVSLVLLAISMMTVVVAGGGFSFLLSWELMTISSFILILFEAERTEVRRAALNYLVMMHIGFMFLVAAFATVYAAEGGTTFAALAGYFSTHDALPVAHPAAPSHVSAVMSGVMIKTGVYGIMRVVAQISSMPTLSTVGVAILVIGIATGLWGVIMAAFQNDIKRLLAYSSIENIGVIFIGMGIGYIGLASGSELIAMCGMSGALLHTVNHSLFKTLLFFGAGNVYSKMHSTALDSMGGLSKSMPVTAILMFVATAAICALPPLNGFISELLIYMGMLDGVGEGRGTLYFLTALVALSLIGGVVVLAFTKLYGHRSRFAASCRYGHTRGVDPVDRSAAAVHGASRDRGRGMDYRRRLRLDRRASAADALDGQHHRLHAACAYRSSLLAQTACAVAPHRILVADVGLRFYGRQ